MDPLFTWIEDGALNALLTETNSVFAFPAILVLHAIGMAFLVGTHAAIALRILGVAPGVPLAALKSFLPVARTGLVLNVFSGVLLLIAYPTKALTNPLFYFKLALIVGALILFSNLARESFGEPPHAPRKRYAALLLVLWASTIAAGRFLAYTYTRLTVTH